MCYIIIKLKQYIQYFPFNKCLGQCKILTFMANNTTSVTT